MFLKLVQPVQLNHNLQQELDDERQQHVAAQQQLDQVLRKHIAICAPRRNDEEV